MALIPYLVQLLLLEAGKAAAVQEQPVPLEVLVAVASVPH
jgi:hypothetical protein